MPHLLSNLPTGGFASFVTLCAGLLMLSPACERPGVGDQGVVGIFGSTGLGWGDFSYPRAISIEPDGAALFIADKSGRVQRFSNTGEFEVGWWMPDRQAGKPVGLTVHWDGRLFVADTHYSRVVVFDRDGHLLTAFGEHGDGPGQFRLVTDVAVDRSGTIYVSEYGGNDRISMFSADLQYLGSFGEQPVDGARLSRPAGLAIDEQRPGDGPPVLWVADACNHRIVRFGLDGAFLGAFGEVGVAPGQLRWPYDINVCRDGSLLVSEFGNNRIQWFDRSGRSLKTWGGSGRRRGRLYSPWGAVEGASGVVYVLDSLNNRVQLVKLRR